MHDHDRANALNDSRATVAAAFAGLDEARLSRRPADGQWNAWEIAYHLFDIERWYIAKLCEAAEPDRVAALARFIAIWARLRDEALALAAEIPTERLEEAGLLTGVPEWTPAGLLAAMAGHDREHAAQVREAAGARMRPILHITTRAAWEAALSAGQYRGDTLDSEGFIHCSTPVQVASVANERFLGTRGLALLEIDPDRVVAPVRHEGATGGALYPHIYGPLNLDAVISAHPFEPQSDGRFALPPALLDA